MQENITATVSDIYLGYIICIKHVLNIDYLITTELADLIDQ